MPSYTNPKGRQIYNYFSIYEVNSTLEFNRIRIPIARRRFHNVLGVLTIYMEKPEIPVGESNGSRHSVWEASENVGCDLQRCNVSTSCRSVQLILIYSVAVRSPTTSNFIVLCLCTGFPPGWFV